MIKKYEIKDEDLEIFQQAMKGVQPLKHNKITPIPAEKRGKPLYSATAREINSSLSLNESQEIALVESESFISFKQESVSYKILRNLRKGQYNVEAVLDLHGMSVENARIAVYQFLQDCLQDGIRVALMIHGKGRRHQMPILKNKLNHWLRHVNEILAFCSASAREGSRGAIYVLLKRIPDKN